MQGVFHYGRVHTRAHTIARTRTHTQKMICSLRSQVCLRAPPSLHSPAPSPQTPLALPAGGLPLRAGAPLSLSGDTPSPFGALWGCPPAATTSPPPSASIGGVPGFAPRPSSFVAYGLVLRAGGSLASLACLPTGSVNRRNTSHHSYYVGSRLYPHHAADLALATLALGAPLRLPNSLRPLGARVPPTLHSSVPLRCAACRYCVRQHNFGGRFRSATQGAPSPSLGHLVFHRH